MDVWQHTLLGDRKVDELWAVAQLEDTNLYSVRLKPVGLNDDAAKVFLTRLRSCHEDVEAISAVKDKGAL